MPYSSRFAAATVGGSSDVLYTVPAQYVAVIRDVEVWNQGGTSDSLDTFVNVPGPLSLILVRFSDIAAGQTAQWKGRVVMNAGDTFSTYSGGNDWGILVSGYLLSAP